MNEVLDLALAIDIGEGDITSKALFSPSKKTKAIIIARESGIVAGVEEVQYIFKKCGAKAKALKKDGARFKKGDKLLQITGSAISILSAERTALNVLSRMSGIATATNKLARYCIVAATRKGPPGMILLDKKAVELGGGISHRLALWDMTLIKDTHLDAMGGTRENAIRKALSRADKPVEIEVMNEREALLAASLGADIVMLDNFTPAKAKKTITKLRKHFPEIAIELSGGITEKNIREFAKAKPDFVSLGALTGNVKPIDFSMKIVK